MLTFEGVGCSLFRRPGAVAFETEATRMCILSPCKWKELNAWGFEELDTTERLHFHFSLSCVGEGNANPLQCSCLENPRDGGA